MVSTRDFRDRKGDIFTTNCVKATELEEKDYLVIGEDGYLAPAEAAGESDTWQVVQVYTMPDGQPGVKIIRIN